jgi:hypothetical protein
MAATIKNIAIGPATVSFGGADFGAIKSGSVEISYEFDNTEIGNNENLPGVAAVYYKLIRATVKFVAMETSLANIKMALTNTGTVGGANPNTFAVNYGEGMLTSGALIITGAAPRTTAGAAQTRTITAAAAVPSRKTATFKMGHDAPNEFECEFVVLLNGSSDEVAYSDVNA